MLHCCLFLSCLQDIKNAVEKADRKAARKKKMLEKANQNTEND